MESENGASRRKVLEIGVDESSLVDLYEAMKGVDRRAAERRRIRERIKDLEAVDPVVFEGEKVPLSSFRGVAGLLVSKFHSVVQYAVHCSFMRPHGDMERGVLLRLDESFKPVDFDVSKEIAPGVSLSYNYDWCYVSFRFLNRDPGLLSFFELEEGVYLELGADEYSRLAALSFIAVSLEVLGPVYDGLVMYISSIFPFEPEEVVLAGYDDVVERCGRLLRSDDPRLMNRHILLAGPPGCGKSMIAKRVAVGHPEFVRCSLTRVDDWLYWVSMLAKILVSCERRVLLVIDEIDELGMRRGAGRKGVYELLRLMDGVQSMTNVTILATTNRLKDLDEALLRPGRFGPVMYVDVPDVEQFRAILEYYGGRYGEVDVERILDEVEGGFSGAEIRIAFEDCIVDGCDVSTEGVIANLRSLREMKEKVSGKKLCDYDAGWSKAMGRIRTKKLTKEGRTDDEY